MQGTVACTHIFGGQELEGQAGVYGTCSCLCRLGYIIITHCQAFIDDNVNKKHSTWWKKGIFIVRKGKGVGALVPPCPYLCTAMTG